MKYANAMLTLLVVLTVGVAYKVYKTAEAVPRLSVGPSQQGHTSELKLADTLQRSSKNGMATILAPDRVRDIIRFDSVEVMPGNLSMVVRPVPDPCAVFGCILDSSNLGVAISLPGKALHFFKT